MALTLLEGKCVAYQRTTLPTTATVVPTVSSMTFFASESSAALRSACFGGIQCVLHLHGCTIRKRDHPARVCVDAHGWMSQVPSIVLFIVGIPIAIPVTAFEQSVKEMGFATQSQVLEEPHIGEALVTYAEENCCDMVLTSDRRQGVIDRMLLGSTSRFVLRHAGCSVLIARGTQKKD